MRYVAISLATLALIAGLSAGAFVAAGRSVYDPSPRVCREWARGWNDGARRLMTFAIGLLGVAMVLFVMSFA